MSFTKKPNDLIGIYTDDVSPRERDYWHKSLYLETALKVNNGSMGEAAKWINVSAHTFRKWLKDDPRLDEFRKTNKKRKKW